MHLVSFESNGSVSNAMASAVVDSVSALTLKALDEFAVEATELIDEVLSLCAFPF